MVFMPEDVLNKNFTATQFRRGYDEHEVDDFLDEIVVEMRRLTSENEDLSKQLQTCLEDKGVIPPDAKDKIAAARQAVENAEKESAARIAKAKADAEQAESRVAERLRAEKDSAARIAKANADAERAEAQAAERKRAAEEAAKKNVKSSSAVPAAAEAGGVQGGLGSAAGVLALAEKLHAEYVTEGRNTRERLISEGQLRHDQVVGEAIAQQEELRSTAQAKHDGLIAEATARHEQLITEARERATGMVAEAQQKRAEVLQTLGHERTVLQTKIDELRAFERDYRARLKSHLEAQLHQLEQTGADETAAKGQ
jgi:DivIVA domain-containing protein